MMADEQMLAIATNLFPRWREDIQPRFVTELGRAILEAGGASQERAASPDWQSRAMFVARVEAVPKGELVSPNWVLNLLNDCDMLAGAQERAAEPYPGVSPEDSKAARGGDCGE